MLVLRQTEGGLHPIHEVEPDKSTNNPDCVWVSIGLPDQEKVLDCSTDSQYSLFKWTIWATTDSSVVPDTAPLLVDFGDGSGRERVWKRMFPDTPVPNQDKNGVDACFGILTDIFGDEAELGETLDQILREVKGM